MYGEMGSSVLNSQYQTTRNAHSVKQSSSLTHHTTGHFAVSFQTAHNNALQHSITSSELIIIIQVRYIPHVQDFSLSL